MNKDIVIIASGVFIVSAIVGFGIADIVILSDGKKYTSHSEECPKFPNVTEYSAESQLLSLWHAKYNFEGLGDSDENRIEQNCPTLNNDVNLIINGNLMARSDGKTLSLTELTYINDCHGDRIYITESGSAWQTFINGFNIDVSFLLKDPNDNILAYVEGDYFFNDDVDIKSPNGVVVASMHRRFLELPRVWHFSIKDQSHPGADPIVLSMVAGRRAFKDPQGKQTDICNEFFYKSGYTVLAFTCFVFVVICIIIYITFKDSCCCVKMRECCHSCRDKVSNYI